MTAKSETHLDSMIEAIRLYAGLGWHLLLTHGIRDGICTCENPACDHAGKHPLLSNGVYGATDDSEWLIALLNSQPDRKSVV